MSEVVLESLRKTYANGVQAVRELSLRLPPQQLLALLGPSGCGKTTTLRLIAGLETPTQGRVLLDGKDVTHWPPYRRNVAMLFQTPALYPHLRIRDNLVFGLRSSYNWLSRWFARRQPAELQQRVDDVVRLLRLDGLTDRKPAELSGGERQRVAFGRALIRRPAVFLFDEPLAHVDPSLRWQIRQELKLRLVELRATTLWVTHDHAEAMALGDLVGVMHSGTLQQLGTPKDVYEQPVNRTVAGLLGSPPMNLLEGELRRGESGWCWQGAAATLPIPDEVAVVWEPYASVPVTLGIRPEHVRRCDAAEQPDAAGWSLDLQVLLKEYAGGATLVTLQGEKMTLVCRWPDGGGPSRGERIKVNWDWQRIHLFEGTTGRRLQPVARRRGG